MEDGQGLSSTWSANSDLPHRSREGCDLSFTEGKELLRDAFPQELSRLNGPNFLGVNVLLVVRDAVFWDLSRDILRLCQRADPLVVVKLLRSRVLLLLKKHQLRVEQEAALLQQVSRRMRMSRPRNRRLLWPAPAKETLAPRCSCLSPVGPGALIGDSVTYGSEAMPVLIRPCSLIALHASL